MYHIIYYVAPPTPPYIEFIDGNNDYIVFSLYYFEESALIGVYYIHINNSIDKITPNSENSYNYTGSIIPMHGDYVFSISAGNCMGNSTHSQTQYVSIFKPYG